MCPRRAKKLMILSRSEYLVILTPQRYRRTSTTVSSPSVRGGGAHPGDACRLFGHATTPPRMYEGPVRCSGGIATPPGPLSCLTLERLTTGSSPLTLQGRALSSGPIHPVVVGQPIGTLWSNIRARPTARSPPCRPDTSVSPLQVPAAAPSVTVATPRRRVPPLRTCHNTTPHVSGPGTTLR